MNIYQATTVDTTILLLVNTLGMSILVQTLQTAFKANGNHKTEASRCFAFVQGTGLDLLLEKYGLGYDPYELRDSFNWLVKHAS